VTTLGHYWIEELSKNTTSGWPLEDLVAEFGAFSPQRIRARIDGIEGQLERLTFDQSKVAWLQRLKKDQTTVRAIDALERILNTHRNQLPESEHATFRQALNGVLIWVTTAPAPQSIPLEPDLFDIVVIDEASQCTLTNLLPLIYRGKALAIIGDDNQLPAIPTIQEAEEIALASKYELEEYLPVIGHAGNDVYKTATQSLPGRRSDVLMLTEHFRSHPQIIGFSNRYIYQQRLELKKDPSWGHRLPIGSGVHLRHVAGTASKGENGRSWTNVVEAQAVLDLIRELRSGNSRHLSLGVVTPFAGQKEFIRAQLDSMQMSSEVLVDTAYGFQGDERDIMIFSPVVARGITRSACRWVESPPNLINVSITRAREALFLVGDVDFCCQQEGILRKLGLYCKDIKLLRDTSPAELELFSWMVVKGWEPLVHPRIADLEVDFVLRTPSRERLVIEVDGRQHENATEQDRARDAFLAAQNYRVLRVLARDVFETPFEVIHRIEAQMNSK
jgi:superfamily I DNA and/or RNA helicase